MASQESGQANKSNSNAVPEEHASKSDGEATASNVSPKEFSVNARVHASPSAPAPSNQEAQPAAASGCPPVKKPSEEPRKGESPPGKTQTHEKSTVAKHAPFKRRTSATSIGKHGGGERRVSKASVSSKAGVRASSGTSVHRMPSSPTPSAATVKSDGAVSTGEHSRPQRYCHAATQNQMTPELFIGSPGTAPQPGRASDQRDLERGQPAASPSTAQEPIHRAESGEALGKDAKMEEGEAVAGEEKKAEEEEGEEERKAEEKKPAEKKPRKRAARGFKMPDGTYVGLKEKNRYLRAMHKEHLKCDYVPFCILGVLAVIVITLVYLYAYRPDIFNRFIEASKPQLRSGS